MDERVQRGDSFLRRSDVLDAVRQSRYEFAPGESGDHELALAIDRIKAMPAVVPSPPHIPIATEVELSALHDMVHRWEAVHASQMALSNEIRRRLRQARHALGFEEER